MIDVTQNIQLDEDELQFTFVRSSGPGGQHVNKVATAVQLRFNVMNSRCLPDDVRQRLITQAGKRITDAGILLIDARRYRSQERNRCDAVDRLREMIEKAAIQPKRRRKTRPSLESKRRRLEAKHRRGEKKKLRRTPFDPEA